MPYGVAIRSPTLEGTQWLALALYVLTSVGGQMKTTSGVAYVCAGLGLGGALGVLLAPASGDRTRYRLRAAALSGKDQVKAGARAVSEAFEHRDEIIQAGKERLSEAWEEGRMAYRETADQVPAPPTSLAASLGVLALGAVALTAGYQLTRGMGGITGVGRKLEAVLDASRAAVRDGSRQISAITSKTHDLLGAFESAVQRGIRRQE